MKTFLGLDLGTNSIGWALVKHDESEKEGQLIAAGSRIIPMSQDILGKFDNGQSISQTAERTGFRSIRRLRERHLLRRERLHRVLNILGFLPEHYAKQIDFEKHFGQFIPETEPKLPYNNKGKGKAEFLFKSSFNEMLQDFVRHHPQLAETGKSIPYDWTIYYLRKKALTAKIDKEELAWLLLHFNQKRGYYQLRGEDEEETQSKRVEFYSLRVVEVQATEEKKDKDEVWYNVHLENNWIYRRTSKTPLDWVGKTKEFIVTTDLNDDGTIKKDKEGKEKRSFRAPDENDWTLLKKKTEFDIEKSQKTVGVYIYDSLLQNPKQKIKGKLVRVVERKFYKAELEAILKKQKEFHAELNDKGIYMSCIEELYKNNEVHRKSIGQKDLTHLFLNDILFYQRPLKSKKSLISNCTYERRAFIKDGKLEIKPIKCIAKSHPLFQEFRLWQFIKNLKIYQREKEVHGGKLQTDIDVTDEFLKSEEDWVGLFEWLNSKKEIDQKTFLKYPGFKLKKNADNYRWNFVEDKTYPCNETRAQISGRLNKLEHMPAGFLNKETEESLWHILYSVDDKNDIQKALKTFAVKQGLTDDFIEHFKKFPPFEKEYGSYSAKAIKKLLPLMRRGKYWDENDIDQQTKMRIDKILTDKYDEKIRHKIREKSLLFNELSDFKGLPLWLCGYIVYDRHSEDGEAVKWKTANDIALLPQHSLRNPIVEQVINETLLVVRDIWKQYGNGKENFFDEIRIELGREIKNPADKRRLLTNQINENENTNLRIKALLAELLNDSDVENVRPYSPTQQEILKIYEEGALNAEDNVPDDILKIAKQAQPTTSELVRYKLWLQQKYRSPYTGEIIPLNKLFTRAYDIEHIIPQSRYFDDSFSNKVICEAVVNGEYYKSNRTGYEFIKEFGGTIVNELSTRNKSVQILTPDKYEFFVKNNFSKSRGKMKKLLMEEIPESFIQRQLNDSRYISKVIKNLMSNIVRTGDEQEVTSKNVIVSNGSITSTLKHDWGLNDVWNEIITPRFEELNRKTNSKHFGDINKTTNKFLPSVPLELQKGFTKKRIDHRHHSLDAIVIACVSRSHVNYLNNEASLGKGKTKEEGAERRYDLRHKLCFKKYNTDTEKNYKWVFRKPWENFTQDTKEILYSIIVSFKQNLRVITKTTNHYLAWKADETGKTKKELVPQVGRENWAIRKPMHKETVSGLIQLRSKKSISLTSALDNWEMLVDKSIRNKVKELLNKNYDKKQIISFFREQGSEWNGVVISKVEIYYWNNENVASRVKIDETFNISMIESITDSGIQKIMRKHLEKFNEEKEGKIIEHPELAFCQDGLDALNKGIMELNGGKPHQPIYKVRTYEPKGNKFAIGHTGNKRDKYVEAAKGTNLFFAVYIGKNGRRSFETIPLNIIIERQKQGLSPVPEITGAGDLLLFYLSPNDLVYVPNEEEQANSDIMNFNTLNKAQVGRVYKVVSFTGRRLYCLPHSVAISIVDKVEFTQLNKLEFSPEKFSIKEVCVKLKVDRLGKMKSGV